MGKIINKSGSSFQSLGNGMSKFLKGVTAGGEFVADLVSMGSVFFPELEPLGELATFVADTAKMGSDLLKGQSLTSVLKSGVPKLLKDELYGAIPGYSTYRGASDLISKTKSAFDSLKQSEFSNTLMDAMVNPAVKTLEEKMASNFLDKRTSTQAGLPSIFDLQLK